jgi:hypothetical protein
MRERATILILGILVSLAVGAPATASAAWTGDSSGDAYAAATAIGSGNTPTVAVSGRNVAVNWSPSSVVGGPQVISYVVKRYDGAGQEQAIGDGCSGAVSSTSCTEQAVPPGNWRYTVRPKYASWTGAESGMSAAATVGSPSLSLSPSTVTSLPRALSGQIQNFIAGQNVTFRLDDPTSGLILAGSITPTPVPNDGSASVSVTVPASTSNGTHTIYAIGSQGDRADFTVTVTACPGPQTLTASADSYVDQALPTSNFGTSPDLLVRSRNGQKNARTLVTFNLPSVPTGCAVTGATLRLFASSAAASRTLNAYRAGAGWTESGVTWNNQPATAGVAASTTSGTGWREWPVTSQVLGMYGGANNGFIVMDAGENTPTQYDQRFSSRQGTNPPQLVLTFG